MLVGGTFDPPHVGHLLMAECARWQSAAREARFIPAGDPYRKAGREVSSAGHRLAMTRLAILHNDAFTVDDREVRRSGPSYTVDTLEEYHAEGERDLALVIGIDALADMPAWKTPARIGELARLLVALKGEDASALGPLARAAGLAR
ncbi:MAG: nicotinate-nicotinamide nucleotide adenylyltransferase, partial [Chloroflexi bacterium CFX7]|nr:nicotinate-nicotinamide nucleotide adenylyltransferase [Chloroflexi bacterium CFX7]